MDQRQRRQQQHSSKSSSKEVKNNDHDRDNDEDDRRFLKQFAAQIGAVLREQEEQEEEHRQTPLLSSSQSQKKKKKKNQTDDSTTPTPTMIDEYVYDLYKSLVYDEPIIDRRILTATNGTSADDFSGGSSSSSNNNSLLQVVAAALGRQLLLLPSKPSPQSNSTLKSPASAGGGGASAAPAASIMSPRYNFHYALSNRFVNGLLYMCRSRSQSRSQIQSLSKSPTETTKTSTGSSRRTNRHDDDDDDQEVGNDHEKDHASSSFLSSSFSSPSSQAQSQSSSIRYIMSKLAFVALVEIPLNCCRVLSQSSSSISNNDRNDNNSNDNEKNTGMDDTIRRYLGSYKGTTTAHTTSIMTNGLDIEIKKNASPGTIKEEEEEEEKIDAKDEVTNEPEQEVWAAESDPSDYDYGAGEDDNDGSGDCNNNNVLSSRWLGGMDDNDNADEEDDWYLDPKSLSKPDPQLDDIQTTDAISSLLHHANYNIFEPIFMSDQSRPNETLHVVNCLKELVILMLLTSPSSTPSSIVVQLLKEHGKDHAILSPLWILRDAAMYHPEQYSSHYMEVLQMLLASQDQQGSRSQTEERTATSSMTATAASLLSTSSIVGLSSLSSWCLQQYDQQDNYNNKKNRNAKAVTVNAIVESMNDMSLIIEQALQPSSSPSSSSMQSQPQQHSQPVDSDSNTKLKLSMTLVPILECLSGIWYNQWGPAPISRTPVAQTLLNSGFLRQILNLATTPVVAYSKDTAESPSLFFQPLHHALWGLCVAYPKVVGKYVFRYPGTAQLVRRYVIQNDSTAEECVESFLWNMFAWIQCLESNPAASGTSSKIVWKNGSKLKGQTSTPLTVDECSAVCEKAWACLCQLVEDTLNDRATTPTSDDKTKEVLDQWERLLAFARIPLISMKCQSIIDSSHHIEKIASTLSNLPKMEEDSVHSKPKTIKFKQEDNVTNHDNESDEVIEVREKNSSSNREVIYGQAHRLIKEYRTYIRGGTSASAKTD